MEDEKWCTKCEIEDAEYKYGNGELCIGCLLEVLEEEQKISTWTATHYTVEDEYFGNDNDDDLEAIAENIARHLKIKKLENE